MAEVQTVGSIVDARASSSWVVDEIDLMLLSTIAAFLSFIFERSFDCAFRLYEVGLPCSGKWLLLSFFFRLRGKKGSHPHSF